ncbi:MAG: hypothetical protein QXO75_07365 [Nitrososphaerota archaeon]
MGVIRNPPDVSNISAVFIGSAMRTENLMSLRSPATYFQVVDTSIAASGFKEVPISELCSIFLSDYEFVLFSYASGLSQYRPI